MNDLFNVKDKVVAITGAGGVLCSAIAKALAMSGARIAVLNRTPERGQKVADAITAAGGIAQAIECNVLYKESVLQAKEAVEAKFGKVDALINGAGGNDKDAVTTPEMTFFDMPVEAIDAVFALNFRGTVLTSQVFAKDMIEKGRGIILNISSMSAFRPLTNIVAYSAAKAAVSNFTQWLAVHMCQNYSKDIRVNAIAPGFFLTRQNKFLLTDKKTGQLTTRGKAIIDHTPAGRFGDAEDLAGTVIWLLSDAAKFVNGIVVPVDGGFSAFCGV